MRELAQTALRLLVVEDDEVDRMMIRRALLGGGLYLEIEDADEGQTAASRIAAGDFDCVLLDHNLPGTDGLTIVRQVRERGLDVPLVVLTGQTDARVAALLMKEGAADYLDKKDLTADRLSAVVRQAVRVHRAEQAAARANAERLSLEGQREDLYERERAARAEAETASRFREELLAVVSHDLRNPLSCIATTAGLLSRLVSLGRPVEPRQVEIITRAARTMGRLIDDLLDMSRIEAGRLTVNPQPCAVDQLLTETVEVFAPLMTAKSLELRKDCEPGLVAHADRSRVLQVLSNLLGNALKFSPPGGRIQVRAVRGPSADVRFEVIDSGPGVPVDEQGRIFDRFWQPPQTERRQGAGLGLYIARALVEAHGGTIGVHSVPGQGSTFHFSLRAAELPAEPAPREERRTPTGTIAVSPPV